MISRPPSTMPPTSNPADLIRKATTNRIQGALQNPNPGLLGPPIAQPPSATPLPPQHIDPIGTVGAQGDPFTAALNPDQTLLGPPTHQPPHPGFSVVPGMVSSAPGRVQPFAYKVFQNALNASGRGTFGTPGAMSGGNFNPATHTSSQALGGFTEPPLPTNPGADEPVIPPFNGPPPGGYPPDNGELDPSHTHGGYAVDPHWDGSQPPTVTEPPQNQNFTPTDPETGIPVEPDELNHNPGIGPTPNGFGGSYTGIPGETWLGGTPAGFDPNTGNTIFNPLGYGQFPGGGELAGGDSDTPGGSGRGGTSGGPAPDTAWDAGLGKFVNYMGIPIGGLTHAAMEAYRNYRMTHPAGGPGGRGGGDSNSSGGSYGGSETADQRAHGDANFTMAGGNSYYDAPVGESHFNYGTGRYEMDRNSQGFRRNFGTDQQATDPFKFGQNPNSDNGRSTNQLTALHALRNRLHPSTAAERARTAALPGTIWSNLRPGMGYG